MKRKPYSSWLINTLLALLLTAVFTILLGPDPAGLAQSQTPDFLPHETSLIRAEPFKGSLLSLPQESPEKQERIEREAPLPNPVYFDPTGKTLDVSGQPLVPALFIEETDEEAQPTQNSADAPAPAPSITFPGLDYNNWGAGHPPDTVGDVGPNHYIQAINTSIGIYNKSTGAPLVRITFDNFMSQGNFGNMCDTDNYGDPVVLYDTFEDRWIITDFAFQVDVSGNVSPQETYECFAVSQTGDPVNGGWYYYSLLVDGGLGDYPKLGVWPDGIYMSANMFGYLATDGYLGPRVWALNKAQMYAGEPSPQVVYFDGPTSDFTLLPSNARLQTGTPPAGTPNYFLSTWQYLNALSVYKFHVDWDHISLSTFTGPDVPLASTSWPNAAVPMAPSLGGNNLDTLGIRAMMQNQYTNIGGAESLWAVHTVRRANTTGFAAPRWYQVTVTGGTVAANLPQAATWDPDGANVMYRFMPSLAVDRMGNMALGYSTSNSTTKPAIKYAGRLANDPINTLSLTEQVLFQGTGTQTGTCGGTCTRWGDYSAMTLDTDGCTFWYTNMYYATDGLNHQTRIGSFQYPACTPVSSGGTLQGTVTRAADSTPINGATVQLGSRTTTTNASGFYQFTNLPAGTYPSLTVSYSGYDPASATNIVITSGGTTTQDFALTATPRSNCFVDTTQADFQAGVAVDCDLTSSPGDVTLLNSVSLDQQNTNVTTSGYAFTSISWAGQTFIPSVTGILDHIDLDLFCSGCTGTTPNITVSIRATSGNVPTGSDLATTTITGFSSGAGGYYTADFSASNLTLNAGTRYAVIFRAVSNPSAGTYAYVVSGSNTYANGRRVTSTNSGLSWTSDNATDLGFKVYMQTGYPTSGTLTSSLKDSNPATGFTPYWTTLSWNASTLANTNVQFQVAASNTSYGPFNFVGPDGTAATYFTTSGASLSQFDGFRYLKYKAYLTTSSNTSTPTLNDVTVCVEKCMPTITVTNANDSGPGSLRQALVDICPGGTITFTGDYTIILTSSLTLNKNVTINGAGYQIIISGDTNTNNVADLGDVRVFYVNLGVSATLSNLTITNGYSDNGAGMYNNSSSLTLTQITFSNSVATVAGGGLYNANANPTLTNVVFINNAASDGGGIFNSASNPTLTNATFEGNAATNAGGALANQSGNPVVQNSVLWGNTAPSDPQISNVSGSTPTISYSDIQGSGGSGAWVSAFGTDGGGNLDADPLFVNVPLGDLRLSHLSPVINVGNNGVVTASQDRAGVPRIMGSTVEMGAYEVEYNELSGLAPNVWLDFSPQVCARIQFANVGTLPTAINITLTHETPSLNGDGLPRRYEIVPTGGSGYQADVELCYEDKELPQAGIAPAEEPNLHAYLYAGSPIWIEYSIVDTLNNTVTAQNVSQFGIWGLGIGSNHPTAVGLRSLMAHAQGTPWWLLTGLIVVVGITGWGIQQTRKRLSPKIERP